MTHYFCGLNSYKIPTTFFKGPLKKGVQKTVSFGISSTMSFIKYKYLVGLFVGLCLLAYGAYLFFNGDKDTAQALFIWGSLSIAFSLLLNILVAKKSV
jgi:hypothetical protein